MCIVPSRTQSVMLKGAPDAGIAGICLMVDVL